VVSRIKLLRAWILVAALLGGFPALAETGQTFPPLGWDGAYLRSEFLSPYDPPERWQSYYEFAKTAVGTTPLEACSAGYIASSRFYFLRDPEPFEARVRLHQPPLHGYICEVKSPYGYWWGPWPLESAHVNPICSSYGLAELNALAQGQDAHTLWRRSWALNLPAGAKIPSFDYVSNQSFCPAGTKLHSGKSVCAKMPDIVIGFF